MHEISRRFKVEVVIETFPSIPDNLKSQYDKTDKNFFRRWARRQAADGGVKGIYLLVCKDPPHITVEPDDSVREKWFTQSNSEELATTMAGYFRKQQNDLALTEAVNFIQRKLQANTAPRGGAAPPVQRPPIPGPGQAPSRCRNSPAVLGSHWWG